MLGRHSHQPESPRYGPRTQFWANVVFGLVLAAGIVLLPAADSEAMPIAPRTDVAVGNGSSCIAAAVGFSGTEVRWNSTSFRTTRWKCYYGGTPTGVTHTQWLTEASTPTNCPSAFSFSGLKIVGSNDYMTSFASGCLTNSGVQNFTPVVVASGYIEFTVDIRLNSANSDFASQFGVTPAKLVWSSTYGIGVGAANSGVNVHAGTWVKAIDFDSTMPPYRWGPEYVANACESLDMYVAEPGRTFAPGEFAAVEWLGATPTEIGETIERFRYRWSPADPWSALWQTGGVLNPSPPAEPTLVRNSTTGNRTAVTLEIECTPLDGDVRYLRGDSSWSEEPQPTRACAAIVLGWPEEGIYSAGDQLGISLIVADSAGADEIAGLVVAGGRFGNSYSDTLTEVTPVSSITFLDFDGTPEALPVGPGAYVARFSFDQEWTTDDGLYLRCEDGSGFLNFQFKAPPAVGKAPLPEGYDDRFDDCLEGVDFGWRPSSWVPAFFRTTGCVAEVLFVPIDSDVQALTDGASEASERAPISYIVVVGGEMTGMLSGAPAAVDAGRDGCLTVLGPMEEVGLDEAQQACPAQLDGGNMTTARSIMGAGSWVIIGLSYFGATRKLIK